MAKLETNIWVTFTAIGMNEEDDLYDCVGLTMLGPDGKLVCSCIGRCEFENGDIDVRIGIIGIENMSNIKKLTILRGAESIEEAKQMNEENILKARLSVALRGVKKS
jgi:hypothetical protein